MATIKFTVQPARFDKTGEQVDVLMEVKEHNGTNGYSLPAMSLDELEVLHNVIGEYIEKQRNDEEQPVD